MKHKNWLLILIAPVLLALSFPLTLLGKNLGQIPMRHLIVPLVVCIGLVGCIVGMTKLLLRDTWKSMVVSCVVVVVVFTYTDVFSLLSQSFLVQLIPKVTPPFELVILDVLLIGVVCGCVKKTKSISSTIRLFCFVFSLSAFVLSLVPLCVYAVTHSISVSQRRVITPEVSRTSGVQKPDIYYIVPDSHTSVSVMKEAFRYDMTEFVYHLEQKGFQFFHSSTSNYPKTLLSLSSSLNMEYLDYGYPPKSSIDETLLYPFIEDNAVLRFVKHLGYTYYQLGSWWDGTKVNTIADKNILADNEYLVSLTGFSYALMSTTILQPFITAYPQVFLGETTQDKLKRLNFQFAAIEEVTRLPGPKFVFFHIIAPHPPYVFDAQCREIETTDFSVPVSKERYTEQAECIDQKLLAMIDTIQKTSSNSAVIILQSDEGVDFYDGKDQWDKASKEELHRKFPILTALCTPGVDVSYLPQNITPVNIFRFIFNSYFHTTLPLLPDKNYIWNNTHIYDFIDVTNSVQSAIPLEGSQ